MASLTELQAWREELLAARAAGTQRVEHGDRVVAYRSDREMAAALRDLDRRIEAAAAGTAGRAPIRVTTTKGV